MNIVFAMVLSILIKAVSAVVEVAIQMLITNRLGVSAYGDYSFYVSIIEGAYFVLFSGSIKLNTFYLSSPESSLSSFKKQYIMRYIVPIISVIILCSTVMRNPYGILSGVILFVYYYAFDYSSVFFSRRRQIPALLGEYLLGRLTLLIGILAVVHINASATLLLLSLYGLQFVTMVFWFAPKGRKLDQGNSEIRVPIKQLIEFQASDIASSVITYSPTILQYLIGGAFFAGFTGIIAIVKRFINFISGPTAKVFLPEFSRLYKQNEKRKLEESYLMIVRIQMVFIGTIGMVLIGFPNLILHMFSRDLEQYSKLFSWTAASFLLIAGIGPVTGLLQMTGNERVCNRNQWFSIGLMVLVWVILRQEPLFAVYGLCTQAVVEGALKYYSVCHWFGKNVVPVINYIILWIPVAVLRVIIDYCGWSYSFIALILCVILVFLWNVGFAVRDPMIKKWIAEKNIRRSGK